MTSLRTKNRLDEAGSHDRYRALASWLIPMMATSYACFENQQRIGNVASTPLLHQPHSAPLRRSYPRCRLIGSPRYDSTRR